MVRNYIRKTDKGMTYSKEKLREAVAKVRSGELNGYVAASKYNIPRTTLYDYVKGKSNRSTSLGKPPALSSDLEKVIADNLLALEENGFYLGRKDILHLVGLYLNNNKIRNPFKSGKPGECWLSAFSKRTNVSTKPIYKEFGNQDKEVLMVKEFYTTLKMRIDQLELADKPGEIWYMEEHSFYKGKRVDCYDKVKDITILTVFNAEGRKAPLLTIFNGEESHDWMLGKNINVSHKKGMCRDVFKNYFSTVFLNYIDDTRPNLVIFEGQASLFDIDLIEAARINKVTIVKTPSHFENLDISIARTLKDKWSQVFGDSIKQFANIMCVLFDGLQEAEIKEDFKNAGIHPFAAVCDSKFSSDRLKIYEEYKWFKQRHQETMKLNNDTERVMVAELADFQMNLDTESDSSMSMSMTEDTETSNKCSGDMLKRALISVKKEFMLLEQMQDNDRELTKAEEDHLLAWIKDLTSAGFKITEDKLIEAFNVIQGNHLTNMAPDLRKYERFSRTYPKLKEKFAKDIPEKVTPETIKVWLYHVRIYLKKLNVGDVMSHPSRVYNFGEIALNLNADNQGRVTDNEDLTVYVTASADGKVQISSVIFPFKQHGSNAWSKTDVLNDEITDVFYDWLIQNHIKFPVVLFLDQTTHINLHLYEFCKEKQIILLSLPITDIQPLNAIFRPLKQFWNDNNSFKLLKRDDIAKVLEKYIKQDFSKQIKDKFKACGIYPFNTNVEYNMNKSEVETNLQEDRELRKDVSKQMNFLKEVEKRITSDLLEEFKKSGDSWIGDPSHSSLFLFWKKICEENKEDTSKDDVSRDMFVEIFVKEMNTKVAVCKGSDVLM